MNQASFYRTDIASIDAQASPHEAAAIMRDRHVGALVVTRRTREGREVAGLLTDRDLVVRWLAGDAARDAPVGGLMSARIVSVPDTASVGETVATMREEGVRRVLVVAGGGEVVGIASLDDLIEALSTELDDVSQALRAGLRHERPPQPPPPPRGDEALSLPRGALAARWRQITAP